MITIGKQISYPRKSQLSIGTHKNVTMKNEGSFEHGMRNGVD